VWIGQERGVEKSCNLIQHLWNLLYDSRAKVKDYSPHVVGAQLYRLSTVDAHTDVLKPIHGEII